jgi:endonuclease/exonuclease/phosphatase family metal-dependent hydrolase
MSATLKFIQVNIERSKHLNLVIPFLKAEDPDVVTVQELMERDVAKLEEALGMPCFYAPMCLHPAEKNPGIMGDGIFSKHPMIKSENIYYHKSANPVVLHTEGVPGTTANAVTLCDIEKEGEIFRIATTHFTWTPDGKPNDLQRRDMENMLKVLSTQGEFVFSGDFNAPRGGEMFGVLAQIYKDNIPPEVTSSIDGTIHRAGPLPYMVDGIFSTPGYQVSNVVMHTGVSDHCAFSALITKNV